MRYLLIAFNLLTSIPLRASKEWQAGDAGRAAGWYSFVGLCLGGIVAGLYYVLGHYLSQMVAAALALGAWAVLTGGLHLDGLADCFDGMFHASNPERRLQIMKDPNIGSFGVAGLVVTLLIKFSALAALSPATGFGAILLATSLARWCSTLAGGQPMARPGGLGADFALGLKRSSIVLGVLIPLALGILLGAHGIIAIATGLLATGCIMLIARKNLGGVTGDVLGMVIEIVEIAALIPFGVLYGSPH